MPLKILTIAMHCCSLLFCSNYKLLDYFFIIQILSTLIKRHNFQKSEKMNSWINNSANVVLEHGIATLRIRNQEA